MGESNESSVAAVEMVEEGQNQPKIALKRIMFQEIAEKDDEDRISALPDCLLVEILSRLPATKDAISTITLSKRWKYIWTSIHTLIFTHPVTPFRQNPTLLPDFISFVDKTLSQRPQLKLKKFELSTSYDIRFESHFNNWIRYAISCNVEELDISSWINSEPKFLLDQKVLTSSCFTDLRLDSCLINPTGAISWKNLRRLSISIGKLDEDLIENILRGSPLLETLVLDDCYGYRLLNITSKSVKELVFSGYMDCEDESDYLDDIIEINAPNIRSLKIEGFFLLWKVLLRDVSSLVEASLDYRKNGWHGEITSKDSKEEMLKGFILKLRHVKELKIGVFCTKVLSRLEAKGFNFPSNIKFPSNWFDGDSVN